MRTHTHSGQVEPSLRSKNVAWLSHPATFHNAGYAVEPNHIQCGILSETLCGEGENKFRETIQNDMVAKHWPFGNAKQAVWQRKTGRMAMQDRPYCIAKQPIRHHRRHGAGKPLWLSRLRHKADKETTFTETSAITVAWRLRGGTYTTAATPRVMTAARTLNARTAWRRRPTGVGWHWLAAAPTARARQGKPGKHTIPQ